MRSKPRLLWEKLHESYSLCCACWRPGSRWPVPHRMREFGTAFCKSGVGRIVAAPRLQSQPPHSSLVYRTPNEFATVFSSGDKPVLQI